MLKVYPPLVVEIEREAFSSIWTVEAEGQTFDMEVDELREFLMLRNSDEYETEKALDEAYHFRRVTLIIKNPRRVRTALTVDDPQLD